MYDEVDGSDKTDKHAVNEDPESPENLKKRQRLSNSPEAKGLHATKLTDNQTATNKELPANQGSL